MKQYRIPLVWQMYGHIWIDAESEEEAITAALDSDTPLPDGSYIDGSCRLDDECSIEVMES